MLVFLVFIITITLITDLQYTRIILIPLEKIKNKLKRISDPSLFDNAPLKTATSDFHKLDSALIELMDNINLLFRKEKEITVNISHELMTPISIIRSKLENILLIENLNQEIALKVEESLKTLHRLQNLVNSLLMIARIESDQYLREDTFSINEILLDIVNELAPIAEDADVQLEKNLTDDFLARNANKSLIISMFYNVVSNAIKNTPSGGKAIVQTFINQGKYFVTIADTGKGMTEAQMKTLFLRFKTRDKSSGDGTGIGLAISKTIADFHKIEVSVSSIEEKGTIFSFIFPEIS